MGKLNIADLKKDESLIEQYIALRNKFADLLLTRPINLNETREWLKSSEIEIRCLLRDKVIAGVVILYLNKGGEVTFFSRQSNQGTGTLLLKIIEDVAKNLDLDLIWAFVLKNNDIAKHVFEKCGFKKETEESKNFHGKNQSGVKYVKHLKAEINE